MSRAVVVPRVTATPVAATTTQTALTRTMARVPTTIADPRGTGANAADVADHTYAIWGSFTTRPPRSPFRLARSALGTTTTGGERAGPSSPLATAAAGHGLLSFSFYGLKLRLALIELEPRCLQDSVALIEVVRLEPLALPATRSRRSRRRSRSRSRHRHQSHSRSGHRRSRSHSTIAGSVRAAAITGATAADVPSAAPPSPMPRCHPSRTKSRVGSDEVSLLICPHYYKLISPDADRFVLQIHAPLSKHGHNRFPELDRSLEHLCLRP